MTLEELTIEVEAGAVDTVVVTLYHAPLARVHVHAARQARIEAPHRAHDVDALEVLGAILLEDLESLDGVLVGAGQNTPIFEVNKPEDFKGIDIMRTVRSFDPCLPCGVHLYLGDGRLLEVRHAPMFGAAHADAT